MTNKKVAIKGDGTAETGKRIIEYLEGLGGLNYYDCNGKLELYYFINDKNQIYCMKYLPSGYELITLPEPTPEKTFPREMWVWDRSEFCGRVAIVDGMYKGRYMVVDGGDYDTYKYAKEIEPPKPLTTDEKISDLQKQIDELKNMMK